MDFPGCDDGSLVVVVGWASFLVFRVFLVKVPACDDGSLVRSLEFFWSLRFHSQ